MARYRLLLNLLTIPLLTLGLLAEDPAPPAGENPPPPSTEAPPSRPPRFGNENRHERFKNLTPEQVKDAKEKIRGWKKMPDDEKARRRFFQKERERHAREAVDALIKANGLQLNEDQQKQFADIYKTERRKLEMQLRDAMDAKRKEELPAMEKSVIEKYQAAVKNVPAATSSPTE